MAVTWLGTLWAITTAYAVGARVVNGSNVYTCITAGTSAGSGGPTGTGSAIVDGTCTWAYLGAKGGAVIDVAPTLSVLPANEQATLLAFAEAECPVENWGDMRDRGVLYLAAHLGRLTQLGGQGAITAESLGGMSRNYAVAGQGLLSTSFGAEYARLVRLLPTAFGLVV